MRIEGSNRVGAGATGARRASAAGFALPQPETQKAAGGPSAAQPTPGLDALLALQSVDLPAERRQKALGRGRRMLDLLDSLKLGVIEGTLTPATLESLAVALREPREAEDPALSSLLGEIELRAEVELAKLRRGAR